MDRLHISAFRGANLIEIAFSDKIADYTPVVRNILNTYSTGNFTLSFGEGVFNFFPETARDKYVRVSNNDSGKKHIVFDLSNMRNVKVRGCNSTIMLHGKLVPFHIFNSSEITISGIRIDYDYPFVLEGKVIANDTELKTFDIAIHPDNPHEVLAGRLLFNGYDWKSTLGENIVFDAQTRRPIYDAGHYEHHYAENSLSATVIGESIVRLSGIRAADVPPVGSIYVDKGPYLENREIPGFIIQHSSKIQLSDIHVCKSGAMALIAEKSRDISLNAFNVKLPAGSDRMVSSTADATHFVNCRGKIIIENCEFESMLDDAVNVHGTYMCVKEILGDNKFGAVFGHSQQEGFDFGEKGDRISFVSRASLMTVGTGIIVGIEKVNENYYIIDSDMNATIFEDSHQIAIENISDFADVHVNNCSVKYNRARSLLISTQGDVLIENNYFASMMAGIRICGDCNYWFESGNVKNVVVRNNRFEDLGIGGHSPQAVLQIDPVISKAERRSGFYHLKVVFEGNQVSTFDNQVIYALSVDNLSIKNNVFIDSKSYDPLYPDLAVIDVQYCNDVVISDNNFGLWKPSATISIHQCNRVGIEDLKMNVVDRPNAYFYQH